MGSSKGRFLLEGKNKHSIKRERETEREGTQDSCFGPRALMKTDGSWFVPN